MSDENMSNDGTPRKVLGEINVGGSGLQAPGWSKSSAKKTSLPKSSNNRESLSELKVEMPTETVEDFADESFGDVETRSDKQAQLLKRSKPEQKLYGYAKTYLDNETKRLANGLRDHFTQRDIFYSKCKDLEYKLRNCVTMISAKTERLLSSGKDAKIKVAVQEKELLSLRKKEKSLTADVAKFKVELEHTQSKVAEGHADREKLQQKVQVYEKELYFVRDELEKKTKSHESAVAELESQKVELEKELSSLKMQLREEVAKIEHERTAALAELTTVKQQASDTSTKLSAMETEHRNTINEKFNLEQDAIRSKGALENMKIQVESLETQLKQKDAYLERTLETFQQNQNFSQERIAAASEEKKVSEQKIEELTSERNNLALSNAQLEGQVKELVQTTTSLNTQLSEKQNKVEYLEEQVSESKKYVTESAEQLKTSMNQIGLLADQVKGISAELKDNKEKMALQRESLSKANESLSAECENLKAKNETLESELQAVKKTYSNMGASNDERMEQLMSVSKEAELLKRQMMDQTSMHTRVMELEKELQETKDKLFTSDRERRNLHNIIQDLKGKIRVVARIRPMNPSRSCSKDADQDEEGINSLACDAEGSGVTVVTEHEQSQGTKTREHLFKFDRVFDMETKQHEVFEEVQSFVQSALDGYNVCLFSYGQTGSGKTYTMTGDHNSDVHRGIIPRAISNIMSHQKELREKGWTYSLQASFVEIYNEAIFDLLKSNSDKLDIRDSKTEIIVTGASKLNVEDQSDIDRILEIASKNRSVASTDLNHESSRSHSIFTLYITGINDRYGAKLNGSLSMCDLAGSERVSRSNVSGDRLKETQAINKSLSSLATVFTSLSRKTAHIPYRNSKLTHMLQPCFAGQGKTMMILNLSSDGSDLGESLCSLRFGSQVNNTELGKAKRQISSAKHEETHK